MRILACCLPALLAVATAQAAPATNILLTDGDKRIILQPADLASLPSVSVTTTAYTHHGPEHATYTGPLLWTLLTHDHLIDPDPRKQAGHTLLITGSDGYRAALAIGEISPEFENKKVIVAETANGTPLGDAHLKIVVPGDGAASRYVHDIVSIELR